MKPVYFFLAVLAIAASTQAIQIDLPTTGIFGVEVQSNLPLSVRLQYVTLTDATKADVTLSATESYSWKGIVLDGWYDSALTTAFVSVNGTAVKHEKKGAAFQMLPSLPLLAVALIAAVFVDTGKTSKLSMFLMIGVFAVIMTSAFALVTEVTLTVKIDFTKYNDFMGIEGGSGYAEVAISCVNQHFSIDVDSFGKVCTFGCTAGYYKDTANFDCIACAFECAACTSASVCSACRNGYELSGSTCVCPTGNYVAVNDYCEPCGTGCLDCNDGDATCTSCDTGFYLVAGGDMDCGDCSADIPKCTACSESTVLTCSTCSDNYELSSDSTACECLGDRFLENDVCTLCTDASAFGANCVACTAAGCSQCATGYYLDTAGDCAQCGSYCTECSSDTECQSCETDYYPEVGSNYCSECASNCGTIDPSQCTSYCSGVCTCA